ncbi:uncharacterized protein LOC134689698 [Mytilus trossulus]|uniref:uncharacterized protein LOC134689698 n=1 Tax=Mytilus trossulus TaxID=6551 RepID=UPI0030079483
MAPLSEEEENYVRLALLLKGVTPRAVRTYFDKEFPPTSLPSTLNTSKNTLLGLKFTRIINQAQWNLLHPRNGVVDSKTFDVTLMICLIRNLTSINHPINGFDDLPLPWELNPGSDLARIKYYRNELAHHDSNTIHITYFNTAWRDISHAVCRLGGQTMYQECQELKVKILDQSHQEIILEIKQSLEEMEEMKHKMNNLCLENSRMTAYLIELQTSFNTLRKEHMKSMESLQNPIPLNIRELIQIKIENWGNKDKMFVSTKASDYVMKSLRNNSCLTLTAPSGVGKTFIARHMALVLKNIGFNIIPVELPVDIKNYYQPGKKTVFIVDDICGNYTANQQQIDNWKQLLPVINTIIADKSCRIIVSCRLQVFRDDNFNALSPFKSYECNLISDKLCLTSEEKTNIGNTYIGTGMKELHDIFQKYEFFPRLCSLYPAITKSVHAKELPFTVYKNELDKLTEHGDDGGYRICSLALCVLFNNKLEEKWFFGKVTKWQKQIIKDTYNSCRLDRSISKPKLQHALDTLDGTFICKQNGIYRILHNTLFDFLAHYFGQKMIECLIDHGDSGIIHTRLIWQKSSDDRDSNIDFLIEIPHNSSQTYLKRCIKDWSAGNVSVVFQNKNMKISSFRQQLLQYVQRLEKSEKVALVNTKDTVMPKASGNTPLILTCGDGYTDMVQWILCNDVNVDQCNDDGVTGLYLASQNGHNEIVKLLLEKDPNVDLCDKDGYSSLSTTGYNGHTGIVKLLLEENPKVDLCDKDGRSPLYKASQNGHTGIVKLLLEKNPNVDLCDKDGCSPLYKASQNGHSDLVKLLLEKNPNVDLCDKDGRSPLYTASQNGHTDIVKLLLEKNPNVDLCDKDGRSPLYTASQNGHTDIVKLLLEKNPNVDLCDKDGRSPLYTASQNGHTDIIKILLEKNPNVDLCDNDGVTPLIQLCAGNHTSIVQLLMRHKPNIDAQTYDGGNALMFSVVNGNLEIIQLLVKNNADCNVCCCSKQTLIDTIKGKKSITLEEEKQACFDYLIQKASSQVADYISKNTINYVFNMEAGCSPLHFACFMNRLDVVRCLLGHNANINMTNEDETTPLFFACEVGNEDIVRLLLDKGADTQICRLDGKSPLQIATDNGHTSIVVVVSEHMMLNTLSSNSCSVISGSI